MTFVSDNFYTFLSLLHREGLKFEGVGRVWSQGVVAGCKSAAAGHRSQHLKIMVIIG